MTIIDTTVEKKPDGVFTAKDPHPMKMPVKPHSSDFKDTLSYSEAVAKYSEDLASYARIDAELKRYPITEVECVSGVRLDARIINFYVNEPRKAILADDGSVIITHKKY